MDESYNDKIQSYKDSLPLLQDLVPGLGPEKNGELHGGCPSCGSTAGSDRFWVSTTGKYAGKCKCRMEVERKFDKMPAMEIIDIGCNLTHDSFDCDRGKVLEQASEAGVVQIIVTGSTKTKPPVSH